MIRKSYKINEFAALCGTTRHTLYHYDEIGLLCPEKVGKNGYRYYGVEQFDRFQLIFLLKTAGMPLEEIKHCLEHPKETPVLEVLKVRLSDLEQEKQRMERMCRQLSDTITAMEMTPYIGAEQLEFVECREEYLIATKAVSSDPEDGTAALQDIGEHLRYCSEHGLGIGLHVGEIILLENIERDLYKESYYYSRIERRVEDERLMVKPAGTYGVLYHRGSYDTLYTAYRWMKNEIEEKGYKMIGNIYEEDVIDYLSEEVEDNFVMKVSAPVSRKRV